MGHAPSKEVLNQFKSLILDGVVPVNDELGRGTYGVVFTVRYVRMFTLYKPDNRRRREDRGSKGCKSYSLPNLR